MCMRLQFTCIYIDCVYSISEWNAFACPDHFRAICVCACVGVRREMKEWQNINMRYGTKWRRTPKVIMMTKIEQKWLSKLSSLDLYLLRVILLSPRVSIYYERANERMRKKDWIRGEADYKGHSQQAKLKRASDCMPWHCVRGLPRRTLNEIQFQCNFYIYFAYKSFLNSFIRT